MGVAIEVKLALIEQLSRETALQMRSLSGSAN
jgi:hypothetical protein